MPKRRLSNPDDSIAEEEKITTSKPKKPSKMIKKRKQPILNSKGQATEEKKTCSAQKITGNEIDEIFSSKKRRKPEQENAKQPSEDEVAKQVKMKKSKVHEETGFVDPPSRPRKRTNEGFSIYTEEELGIGKADAGGTPLCPFDCSCCF